MSWDKKSKRGPYYYRSVRRGKRVFKEYLGRGDEAEAAARAVEERRQDRAGQCEARMQEQARLVGAEQQLRDLRGLVDLLVRAVLHGMGYHVHRGEYRRRRHGWYGDDRGRDQQVQEVSTHREYRGAVGDSEAVDPVL